MSAKSTTTARTAATRKSTTTPKGSTVSTTAKRTTARSKTAPAAKVQPKAAGPLVSETNEKIVARAATLAHKAPSDLHVDMAAWMTELTGVQISPKMAQVVANLRMDYQASASNKARDAYKGLQPEEIAARSEHMTLANKQAKAAIAKRLQEEAKAEAAKSAKKAPARRSTRKAVAAKA